MFGWKLGCDIQRTEWPLKCLCRVTMPRIAGSTAKRTEPLRLGLLVGEQIIFQRTFPTRTILVVSELLWLICVQDGSFRWPQNWFQDCIRPKKIWLWMLDFDASTQRVWNPSLQWQECGQHGWFPLSHTKPADEVGVTQTATYRNDVSVMSQPPPPPPPPPPSWPPSPPASHHHRRHQTCSLWCLSSCLRTPWTEKHASSFCFKENKNQTPFAAVIFCISPELATCRCSPKAITKVTTRCKKKSRWSESAYMSISSHVPTKTRQFTLLHSCFESLHFKILIFKHIIYSEGSSLQYLFLRVLSIDSYHVNHVET